MGVRKVELTHIYLPLLTLLTPYLGNNSLLLKRAPQQILSLMAYKAFKMLNSLFSFLTKMTLFILRLMVQSVQGCLRRIEIG